VVKVKYLPQSSQGETEETLYFPWLLWLRRTGCLSESDVILFMNLSHSTGRASAHSSWPESFAILHPHWYRRTHPQCAYKKSEPKSFFLLSAPFHVTSKAKF
jgi:hypothetical protein